MQGKSANNVRTDIIISIIMQSLGAATDPELCQLCRDSGANMGTIDALPYLETLSVSIGFCTLRGLRYPTNEIVFGT